MRVSECHCMCLEVRRQLAQELDLFFHPVVLGHCTQVARLGGKHLYHQTTFQAFVCVSYLLIFLLFHWKQHSPHLNLFRVLFQPRRCKALFFHGFLVSTA